MKSINTKPQSEKRYQRYVFSRMDKGFILRTKYFCQEIKKMKKSLISKNAQETWTGASPKTSLKSPSTTHKGSQLVMTAWIHHSSAARSAREGKRPGKRSSVGKAGALTEHPRLLVGLGRRTATTWESYWAVSADTVHMSSGLWSPSALRTIKATGGNQRTLPRTRLIKAHYGNTRVCHRQKGLKAKMSEGMLCLYVAAKRKRRTTTFS